MLPELTLVALKSAATTFAQQLSQSPIGALYGITDGKAVGTYVEQVFRRYLENRYMFTPGNAASGVDFPGLAVDMKATSIAQPQSSCPFKDATQKVYGLGYHLLVFVYEKRDDDATRSARLDIRHIVFVDRTRTADYQTTLGIADILGRNGNKDDLIAFLEERHLPLDEIGRSQLADRILRDPPMTGFLTISNALQWRLQYSRVIAQAGKEEGVEDLRG